MAEPLQAAYRVNESDMTVQIVGVRRAPEIDGAR